MDSFVNNGTLSDLFERLKTMSPRVMDAVPAKEPRPSDGKWKYPVAIPYIAPEARDNVLKALDNGLVSSAMAPVQELEAALRKFYNVPIAKACNNGCSSLTIALKLAKIGPGETVLIPSMTMIAVANAVVAVGAEPIFVDCAPGKLNPSLNEYEDKRVNTTKALIVAYTYGTTVDSEQFQNYCHLHGLTFIEDISEAVGTLCKGRLVGTFGDFGCGSMYANKIITAGDGGFLISRHESEALSSRATSYTNNGFVKDYHFVHFEHSGNYKMSGLAAALATPSVPRIPEVLQHRNVVAKHYRKYLEGCPGIKLMEESEFGPDAPWVFGIECDSKEYKNKLRVGMAKDFGIETRDYFYPIHLQPLSQKAGVEPPSLPNAEKMGKSSFYLPTHAYLTAKDMLYICDALRESAGVSKCPIRDL